MNKNPLAQRKLLGQIVKKMRVLVADDYGSMRNVIVNTLRTMGFVNVDQASNGKVVLEFFKNRTYDLVLCDWNMPPFMDGIEVLENLKEKGQLENIIFIMITAERMAHNVIRAAEAILDGYLVKPIRAETLERILTKILLKKSILNKGREILKSKGVSAAVEYYEQEQKKVLVYSDAGPPIWLHKVVAETYEKAGDLKKAFEKQRDILKINPQSAWTYEAMGQIYKKNGNTEKALEAFRKALSCNEHFMKAADSLATTLMEIGQEDEALEVIEKASEFASDNVKRQALLEKIYVQKKDYVKAASIAKHIIDLQPRINITENYSRLAKNLMDQDNIEAAYQELTTAIQKRDPLTTSSAGLREAYLLKGETCLRLMDKKLYEKEEEAKKGFRYIINVQKRGEGDDISREKIIEKVMEIYTRLGKKEEGKKVIKKINEEHSSA